MFWYGLALGFACGLLAFVLGIAISGPDENTPNEMDQRYERCIAAAGSFTKDDVDWSCELEDRE